jgi:hypothetical protein
MEQVQRPQVERPSREIGAAGGRSGNSPTARRRTYARRHDFLCTTRGTKGRVHSLIPVDNPQPKAQTSCNPFGERHSRPAFLARGL